MASCIKDKEDKQKSSGKKKKRSRARKRRNVLNAKFPYNRIEKHSGKNIQRRINIKRNNVQLHNSSKASNFLKKGGSNNNSGLKMSDLDKAGKICENVTTTNDSIIVCDSDSESDTNKDVIEIHDSLPEMFAAHENKSDKDEIIILDDSNNEESETPRKRIRWSDKDKESERKSDVVTTPNSIVVIVSNTPSKAEKSTAMEIINIEDSFTEPETNMTSNVEPRSSETPVATSNQSSTRQQCGVLPLSTSTPHQNTKSVGLQIKPPQNIKITVCGGDRSYRKMGTKQSNITNVNTSATTSSTNIKSLVSSDKPNNVLPNITPGSVFGGNLYNAGQTKKEGLRDIVIDGSNVAMGYVYVINFQVLKVLYFIYTCTSIYANPFLYPKLINAITNIHICFKDSKLKI